MTSTKGMLLSALGRLVCRNARVESVSDAGGRLRAITLAGEELRDVAWTPGDKIQLLLPSLDVRTYTPAAWDSHRGQAELLVFDHGDSPGAAWSRRVHAGDACRFVGPQRSLRWSRARPAVLFGDETGIAVALALARTEARPRLACVLEVGSGPDIETVIAAIGLAGRATCVVIERQPSDLHLAEAAAQLQRLLGEERGAELLLTGRAQSIQAIRGRLRDAGVRDRGANKAYWAVGKTGLD